MQIQLNTDHHIHGDESLAQWVDQELKDKLARHRDAITRVEVHLSDTNASRSGDADKRCLLEARIAGRQPVAVTHDAPKVADALRGATEKLLHALEHLIGKERDVRRQGSIRDAAVGEE
jgi:hypothetical protein